MGTHREAHDRNTRLVAEFDAGASADELADRHGLSRGMVLEVLKRAGRKAPRKNSPASISDRDVEILRLWAEEYQTYEEIGEAVNLTRERVRQILVKHDAPDAETIAAVRSERAKAAKADGVTAWDARFGPVIEPLLRQGIDPEEVAARFSLVHEPVTQTTITDYARRHGLVVTHAFASSFSDRVIRLALQAAAADLAGAEVEEADALLLSAVELAELHQSVPDHDRFVRAAALAGSARRQEEPLSLPAANYSKWRDEWLADSDNETHAWPPTKLTVATRVGGGYWNDAVEDAGLVVMEKGRPRGLVVYTDDQYDAAIVGFMKFSHEAGESQTYDGYAEWSRSREVPSAPALRNYYRGWTQAKRRALELGAPS